MTTKKVATLIILGQEIKVYLNSGMAEHGLSYFDAKTIHLNAKDNAPTQSYTLLHEVMHHVDERFHLGLGETGIRLLEEAIRDSGWPRKLKNDS